MVFWMQEVPKPLLPVANRPVLSYVLELLEQSNLKDLIVVRFLLYSLFNLVLSFNLFSFYAFLLICCTNYWSFVYMYGCLGGWRARRGCSGWWLDIWGLCWSSACRGISRFRKEYFLLHACRISCLIVWIGSLQLSWCTDNWWMIKIHVEDEFGRLEVITWYFGIHVSVPASVDNEEYGESSSKIVHKVGWLSWLFLFFVQAIKLTN